MRRYFNLRLTSVAALLLCCGVQVLEIQAQEINGPSLRKLPVPAAQAKTIATALSMHYRDMPEIQIASDVRNQQLVVMAPEEAQQTIAKEVKAMLASHQQAAARNRAPVTVGLNFITWREFEDDLQRLAVRSLPITTSRNGERASFQLSVTPMQGTTVEVDRRNNTVTVIAPQPSASRLGEADLHVGSTCGRRRRSPGTDPSRESRARPHPTGAASAQGTGKQTGRRSGGGSGCHQFTIS